MKRPAFIAWLNHAQTLLLDNNWGAQALISLYISIISGIVVALQYNGSEPFYSTVTIELIAPFGGFWRALHYYSSQFFFLLLLGHVIAILLKRHQFSSRLEWIRLSSCLPIAVLVLFTGYVLRADATGEAAGVIAENICRSIPLIGDSINNLFFDIDNSSLGKVLTHHYVSGIVLGGYTLWKHLKRYPVFWGNHPVLILMTISISIFSAAPIEPERVGLLHIRGPWFFLGLQELLRYLPTFLAGVVTPIIPLLILYTLPSDPTQRNWHLPALFTWLVGYAILTGIALTR